MSRRTKSGSYCLLATIVLLAYLIGGGANPQANASEPRDEAKKTADEKKADAPAIEEKAVDRTKRRIERPLEAAIGKAPQGIQTNATKLDITKIEMEMPLKLTIAEITARLEGIASEQSNVRRTPVVAAADIRDVGKGFIEFPIKSLLVDQPLVPGVKAAGTVATETTKESLPPTDPVAVDPVTSDPVTSDPVAADDNPKVAPGKVTWHDDFEAACAASSESGKPVLLFQLLGQLDQRFT